MYDTQQQYQAIIEISIDLKCHLPEVVKSGELLFNLYKN
jgi:hypothetical protein